MRDDGLAVQSFLDVAVRDEREPVICRSKAGALNLCPGQMVDKG